jgi:hypothetical protein
MAKAKGWDQATAQSVLAEMSQSVVDQTTRFRTTLESHPEIGGSKLEAAQLNATRALDRFLPATSPEGQEIRALFTRSGYGNYAPLVLMLARIGQAMQEDRPLSQISTNHAVVQDTADVLFPSSAKKPS